MGIAVFVLGQYLDIEDTSDMSLNYGWRLKYTRLYVERKVKGFSAVAMPTSMPFFLSVWRH